MALGIAFNARGQQRMTVDNPEAKKTTKWTQAMWEDYRNASAADKKRLIAKWGRPG